MFKPGDWGRWTKQEKSNRVFQKHLINVIITGQNIYTKKDAEKWVGRVKTKKKQKGLDHDEVNSKSNLIVLMIS